MARDLSGLQNTFNGLPADVQLALNQWGQLTGASTEQILSNGTNAALQGAGALNWVKTALINPAVDKEFESYWRKFQVKFDKVPYDKTAWTKEKVKEAFKNQWEADDYDPAAIEQIADVVQTQITNDYETKFDAGEVDKEGKPIAGGTARDYVKEVKDIATKYGIEFSDEAYKHYSELLKTGQIDAYGIEQAFKSTPEYAKVEYDKAYKEYEPKLDEASKRELAIIEQEGTRLSTQATEEFEKATPQLAAAAKAAGGEAGRNDSYVTDSLAKYRVELEKERGNMLSELRLNQAQNAETRRQKLESGQFDVTKGLINQAGSQSLGAYEKMMQQQADAATRLQNLSLDRQASLVQATQDRYIREAEKRQARLTREATEATNQANAKARKLGAWVQPVMGAAMGFVAGGPVGAGVGALSGYASSQLANQGIAAPAMSYTDLRNVGSDWARYFKKNQLNQSTTPQSTTQSLSWWGNPIQNS